MEPDEACAVRITSLGDLAKLPDYLINVVLLHLENEAQLARVACVSRVLRVLACEEPLWLSFSFRNHDGRITYLVRACAAGPACMSKTSEQPAGGTSLRGLGPLWCPCGYA